MSLVWSARGNVLTSTEKSILLRMSDYASDNGADVFPSITTLSLDTGLSRSTTIRAISTLEKKKILTKKYRHKKNLTLSSNLYTINVKKLEFLSKIGSVTMTLGVVSPRHQGSVTMTPDPSIDPPYRNNNSKPEKTGLKSVVVFNNDEKKLRDELRLIKLNDKDFETLIRAYGFAKVKEKWIMLRKLPESPINPIGWLKAACRDNYPINSTVDITQKQIEASRAATEATKKIIEKVSSYVSTKSSFEAKERAMKQLGRR